MGYHIKVIEAFSGASLAAAITLVNTALAADLTAFGQQNVSADNISASVTAGSLLAYTVAVTVQEAG